MINYEKYVDEKGTIFVKSTKVEERLITKDSILKQKELHQNEINRLDVMLEVTK